MKQPEEERGVPRSSAHSTRCERVCGRAGVRAGSPGQDGSVAPAFSALVSASRGVKGCCICWAGVGVGVGWDKEDSEDEVGRPLRVSHLI